MEPLPKAASLKRRVGYTRTVTRVLSSHYPTSLPPESLNKRIVSDDSLSKVEEGVKRKIKNVKVWTSGTASLLTRMSVGSIPSHTASQEPCQHQNEATKVNNREKISK